MCNYAARRIRRPDGATVDAKDTRNTRKCIFINLILYLVQIYNFPLSSIIEIFILFRRISGAWTITAGVYYHESNHSSVTPTNHA